MPKIVSNSNRIVVTNAAWLKTQRQVRGGLFAIGIIDIMASDSVTLNLSINLSTTGTLWPRKKPLQYTIDLPDYLMDAPLSLIDWEFEFYEF